MPVELLAMPEEEEEQEKKSYLAYDVHTLENVINEVVCVFEDGMIVQMRYSRSGEVGHDLHKK